MAPPRTPLPPASSSSSEQQQRRRRVPLTAIASNAVRAARSQRRAPLALKFPGTPPPPPSVATSATAPPSTLTTTTATTKHGGKPLAGVCAVVDVRVGDDAQIDCSDVVARKLQQLGATIAKRLTPRVTHVVVSHFTSAWRDKLAKHRSIEVVSQLWVNACVIHKQRMREAAYFPVNKGDAGGNGHSHSSSNSSNHNNSHNTLGLGSFGAGVSNPQRNGSISGAALGIPGLNHLNSVLATPAAATSSRQGARTTTRRTSAATARKATASGTTTRRPPSTPSTSAATTNTVGFFSNLVESTPTPRAGARAPRQRRALSMEPMPSDAIKKLLDSGQKRLKKQTSEPDVHVASQTEQVPEVPSSKATATSKGSKEVEKRFEALEPLTVRLQAAMKRRQTISSFSTISSTPASANGDCVAESGSEDEAPVVKASSDALLSAKTSGASQTDTQPSLSSGTDGPCSLNIVSPVVPAKGEWACSICSCLNARTRRLCKGCKTSRVAAKKSINDQTPVKKTTLLRSSSTATPSRRRASTAAKSPSVLSSESPVVPRTPSTTATETRKPSATSAKKRARGAIDSEQLEVSQGDLFVDEKFIPTPPPKRARKSLPALTPIQSNVSSMAHTKGSSKKSEKRPRIVIGITGVDNETRGVMECAVHAIDANMSSDSGYSKSRVVKSVDYASGVTHLVVGRDTRRTMKVLFAIARGAWIVSEAWVFSSLEQEKWLPETDFELDMFANRSARTNPESRHIFRSIKFFVGSNVDPSREVLISLIQCAGGEIVNQISVASVCVCGDGSLSRRAQRTGIKVVTPKWVFDSIANLRLEDASKYAADSGIVRS